MNSLTCSRADRQFLMKPQSGGERWSNGVAKARVTLHIRALRSGLVHYYSSSRYREVWRGEWERCALPLRRWRFLLHNHFFLTSSFMMSSKPMSIVELPFIFALLLRVFCTSIPLLDAGTILRILLVADLQPHESERIYRELLPSMPSYCVCPFGTLEIVPSIFSLILTWLLYLVVKMKFLFLIIKMKFSYLFSLKK